MAIAPTLLILSVHTRTCQSNKHTETQVISNLRKKQHVLYYFYLLEFKDIQIEDVTTTGQIQIGDLQEKLNHPFAMRLYVGILESASEFRNLWETN